MIPRCISSRCRAAWFGVNSLRAGPIVGVVALLGSSVGADFPAPTDSEKSTTKPQVPREAAAGIQLPAGFQSSVFAEEPDVRQPISMCFDARGRLWVAECYTYADQTLNYDMGLRDRIVVFEDSKQTGHFDKRTVFWDGGQRMTSIAVGMGGVYALCLPNMVFIPDRNDDLVPDSAPQVMLEGFDYNRARHTMANGLKWGPDGWLYGRQGILASTFSRVAPPGTPDTERKMIGCGVWRYHPTKHLVEALTEGTTNPWGMDWDEHGEAFFINTVIGHLWHMIPGAHYARMFGEDPTPKTYGLIAQHADHLHWDTASERWDEIRQKGVTDGTSRAGGGHAHTGLMIYQGENWPASYQGKLFTINFHGRRLNSERLDREGSGYVGKREPDLAFMSDPWFRGIELLQGPDGGVFVADWSDTGECHDHDGVHRNSGRIYKITYGTPKPASTDVTRLPASGLVSALAGGNGWTARQVQRMLQAKAATGENLSDIRKAVLPLMGPRQPASTRLRALWTLHVTGGVDPAQLQSLLQDKDEHVRTWAIRLLMDECFPPSPGVASTKISREATRDKLTGLAKQDPSPLVRLALASALQRLPVDGPAARVPVVLALARHGEDAPDHNLPLMIWYGLAPLPQTALLEISREARIPLVRRFIARRLAEDYDNAPKGLDELVGSITATPVAEDVLAGFAEGFSGRRKLPQPASWPAFRQRFEREPLLEARVRDLSALFGDGRALDEVRKVALNDQIDIASRRAALQVLIENRAADLRAICEKLLDTRDLAATACAGLALFDDQAVADLIIRKLPSFYGHETPSGVNVLVSRPQFAARLLDAVAARKLSARSISAFQARQVRAFQRTDLDRKLKEVWGELHDSPAEKVKMIATWKTKLTPETIARADQSQGRALFVQACASCHKLYGEGAAIGPDLTGGGRANLDYLLENLADPSAIVPADFRMTTIRLKDGRDVAGIVAARTDRTLTLQTPVEKVTFEKAEIESSSDSSLSLMPDGLLEALSETQVRDLVAYLMGSAQVPLKSGPVAK